MINKVFLKSGKNEINANSFQSDEIIIHIFNSMYLTEVFALYACLHKEATILPIFIPHSDFEKEGQWFSI